MGLAYIHGLQGDDLSDGVVATAKHFSDTAPRRAASTGPPPTSASARPRDVYLRPSGGHPVAGLASVMSPYHELDGIPGTANGWLLTTCCGPSGSSTARSSSTTSPSDNSRAITT